MKNLWEREQETSLEDEVRAYAAEHKVSIGEAYVMVSRPASVSKGEPATTEDAALEEYGLTRAERDADIAAMVGAERRHALEAAEGRASHANTTGKTERSTAMVTSGGVRIPEGFECAATLAGGQVLTCSRCGWSASLTPTGSRFTVVISDRGGDVGFMTRERAGHALEGVATQHAAGCNKSS